MWLVRKVPEDSIWKRWKEYLCGSGPRINADSWFFQKYFKFVDRKKIQTIGMDPIFKYRTLCDIAVWKCGLWEKFQKIRFRERWKDYLCGSGPRINADSWFRSKHFRFVDRRKIQTIGFDPILKFQTRMWNSTVEMWLVRKVLEDSIWKRWKDYLCSSGPRIDADSWFRQKYFRFVDRKKIQTIATDPIFKYQTLCDIALWKCGLWEKMKKIRFGERWKYYIYAVPVQG